MAEGKAGALPQTPRSAGCCRRGSTLRFVRPVTVSPPEGRPTGTGPPGRHLSDPRIRAEAARRLRDLHGYTGNTIAGVPTHVRSDGSNALANARVRTSTFRACRRHRLLTITSTRLTDRADRL